MLQIDNNKYEQNFKNIMKYKLPTYSLLSLFVMLCGNIYADYYEKVSLTGGFYYAGDYLFVYESENVAFNGALEELDVAYNTISVEINDGIIKSSPTVDAAAFYIDHWGSIRSVSTGLYIGVKSKNNGLYTSTNAEIFHNYTIDADGNAVFKTVLDGDNIMSLRYNKANDQKRFRYYLNDTNEPIQIYKKIYDVATPIITPVTGTYYEAQQVSIACETEGATIYYSTDGKSFNVYTEPFTISETTTIMAYAQKGELKSSTDIATITIIPTYSSFAEVQAGATSTDKEVIINFNGQQVVYINGSNAFIADDEGNGLLVYVKNHGLAVGEKITGALNTVLTLYQGNAEIKSFTREGLSFELAEVIPVEKEIKDLTNANQSTLVILKGVTCKKTNNNYYLFSGENSIQIYDKFKTHYTITENVVYDVTGIIVRYLKDATDIIEIVPRTAADVVEAAENFTPVSSLAELEEICYAGDNKKCELAFENLLVAFKGVNHTYLSDGTTGMMMFGESGLITGQRIKGTVKGVASLYYGTPELLIEQDNVSVEILSNDNEVPHIPVTASQLVENTKQYVNKYVILENVRFEENKGIEDYYRTLEFKSDGQRFTLFNLFNHYWEISNFATYSMQGIVSLYNEGIQIAPLVVSDLKKVQDDPMSGISLLPTANSYKTNIYDLTGRRVEKTLKSLYIQNGKKYIIK